MRTMSRSRYHALSWSFMRIRGRSGGVKRARRAGKALAAAAPTATDIPAARARSGAPGREGRDFQGGPEGLLARALRSVIAIIRTRVLPRDTDI